MLRDGRIIELKVFVISGGQCFAFAWFVNVDFPPGFREVTDCGRLCGHVYKVLDGDDVLKIVSLIEDVISKFVV